MTPPHLGGAYPCGDANTVCRDVFGYLIVKYRLKSLLDIGAGYGHCMKFFAEHLVAVTGIDGDPACQGPEQQCPGCVIQHDYTLGPCPQLADRKFDLAWSAEFLEHVEERFLPNYMLDFQRCKLVVATHAEPGQNGHHHVNCASSEYWYSKFKEYGFEHLESETALLRATDRWKAGWGRRTLMVFSNLNA